MKHLFFIFILVIIFSQSSISQFSKKDNLLESETNVLYTSKKVQVFEKMTWAKSSGEIYSYDDNNKLISKITYITEDDTDINSIIIRYTYTDSSRVDSSNRFSEDGEKPHNKNILIFNKDGLLIDSTNYIWDDINREWKPFHKTIFEYLDNKLSQVIDGEYIESVESFIFDRKNIFEYDSLNRLTFQTMKLLKNEEWIESDRYVYSYNDSTGLLDEMVFQRWWNNRWRDNRKHEYIYDEHDNLIEELVTGYWFGRWNNYRKYEYIYTDGLLSTYTTIIWDDEKWQNYKQIKYFYDENSNINETQEFNWIPKDWLNDEYYTYDYDEKGNILETNIQKWDENWFDFQHHLYEYDIKKNLVADSVLQYDSVNSVWVNVYKNSYNYNDNGNRLDSTFSIWFEDNNEWTFVGRVLYNYNNNLLSEEITQNWIQNNDWKNVMRKVYEYTDTSLIITNQKWIDSTETWINTTRLTTYYNNEGDTDSILTEKFSELNYWWRNQQLIIYKYEEGKLINEITYRWLNRWLPQNEIEYKFDNGNLIEKKSYYLTDTTKMLADYYKYTIDKNNIMVSYLYQIWDTTRFINKERVDYTYKIITNVNEYSIEKNQFLLYPNPATEITQLLCDLSDEQYVKIELINNEGFILRKLYEGNLNRGLTYIDFDNSQISPGFYFIRIYGKNISKAIKFIKN